MCETPLPELRQTRDLQPNPFTERTRGSPAHRHAAIMTDGPSIEILVLVIMGSPIKERVKKKDTSPGKSPRLFSWL